MVVAPGQRRDRAASRVDDRRRERLLAELFEEDVEIFTGTSADDQVLDEIAYARWPRLHERNRPTYGAIVLLADAQLERLGAVAHLVAASGSDLDRCRQYADGRRTFLVRTPNPAAHLAVVPYADEAALVRLRKRTGAIIVVRDGDAGVHVLAVDRYFTLRSGVWTCKPYAHDVAVGLRERLPDVDHAVLDALLGFAVHELAPRHIGATFVWRHGPAPSPDDRLEPALRPVASVGILGEPDRSVLRTRLAQMDGAAVLDERGRLIRVEVHLSYSDGAQRTVERDRGTRHTSAKRYSYDHPGVLAVVVSEDGPVTVYREGEPVARVEAVDTATWEARTRIASAARRAAGSVL